MLGKQYIPAEIDKFYQRQMMIIMYRKKTIDTEFWYKFLQILSRMSIELNGLPPFIDQIL